MKRHTRPRIFKFALVATIVGAGIWYVAGDEDASMAATGQYITKPADIGTIQRSVSASGSVRPLITVDIGSQLSGQVAEMLADYNDEVEEGQLLARIDPQTFATRVKQTEAELAVARATVTVQQASITRAKAQLREAERTLARQKDLEKRGNVSVSALDGAETSYATAQADLISAEAQLENARATVAQREAALDQARIDLARTEIRSPIKGTVISRSVDVGQTVAASLQAPTLFQLAQDLSEIQVEANVDEADIGTVQSGNRVSFGVDAFPERSFDGVVKQVRLAPLEESNVVTYTVVISASNADRMLLPGMTANVEIFTGEKHDVVRVANEALRYRPTNPPETVAETEPRRGGGQFIERFRSELALSDEQTEALRTEFAKLRPQAGGGRTGGLTLGPPPNNGTNDRLQARQRMEAMLDKVMKDILTNEQWASYEVGKSARASVRRAQLWVLGTNGKLERANVFLGLSDDDNTEVIRGLEGGAQIVVREERPKG
ncbi:efflux RND transporter periplasmic adaptor subunit [Kordiimonas aestuarii]|uniref:efflux RND transporter periplasmic adaptor subunit n=1 Tax=Kordiimonas aestuarii TaxID=1005925 RepID=UPI0021CE7C73|nr:efflux RND transporter periplasmic adaptor subunit [Kordiimonas aestuarii]